MVTKIMQGALKDCEAEGYIILVAHNQLDNQDLGAIEQVYPHVKKVLARHAFTGAREQQYVLTAPQGDRLVQYIFLGLGSRDAAPEHECEILRRVIGKGVNVMKNNAINNVAVALPDHHGYASSAQTLVTDITLAAHMAAYEFITFKTEKKDKKFEGEFIITIGSEKKEALEKAHDQGVIIGTSINKVRTLVDLPGNVVTPSYVADHASALADTYNLKSTVFGREKAMQLGMGGFCAVDAGSVQPGKFVVLEYACTDVNAPTIALVGKGVTFDSGGISLKPSAYMKGMKHDMAGAAAVMGTMEAVAQLKPACNVIGLMPLVENMPGGGASRQDDIITFLNGKTAEIENTDAEGRLILADALCYAQSNYKLDYIIDIATLTGACEIALGHTYAALMSYDDHGADTLFQLGQETGERVWRLPFHPDYKKAINSPVADMTNIGSSKYKASSITAGLFLSNFVTTKKWAHLDIAGTADGVVGVSYLGTGATGFGVRLMTAFIQNYKR